ncbi:MAG TPA: AsmA family protein [Opitutaceae bacterium]|nr:AsmA family protein [Opitutaceae bacterium]
MKLARAFLIGIAGLAALLAVALGLAFTPAVQTWAVRRVLAGQPGLQVKIGRVAVGLHSVQLDNLTLIQPGVTLTLPSVEIDLPLLSAARKKVFVQKLAAKGWTLDLTAPGGKPPAAPVSPPPATTPAAAFQGVFKQIHLPVDLAVDAVELSGEVIFPTGPKQPPGRAHVTLTGGQLASQQEGKFDFQIDTTLDGSVASVHSVAVHGTFNAALDTPRTFSHLGLAVDATATGTQFPKGAHIRIGVDALRAADGEHYVVALDADGKHLFALNADYPTSVPKLAGTWQLNLHDTDLTPFALGHALPAFEATGEGRLEGDAAFRAVHAAGRLHVATEHLEAVQAELRALGRLTIDTDFDLTQNANDTRVDRLDVTVAGAQPVAEVHVLQPFVFNAKTGELKVPDPAKSLLSVDLKGIPLAWAQPFLSGLAVSGSDATGTLLASARGGGLHLESSAPLAVKDLAIAREGRPLVRLDRASLNFNTDYTPQQGWQADLQASAQAGPKTLFTLQTKAGCIAGTAQPIKIAGQFQADLPAVFAQPALASLAQLTGGTAHLDFQASLDSKKEIEAKLAFSGLAAPSAPSLPGITADVRAELAPDGKITLNVPLVFEQGGRKSDLALSGTLQSGAGGLNLDAKIASDLIMADDLKAFSALQAAKTPSAAASPAPVEAAGSAPTNATRDAAPPWQGVSGRLMLALKKVVYGQFEADDIAGDLKLGPDALALDQLRAMLGSGGAANLNGTVAFASSAPEPYSLKADVKVSDVDSAPLFRALDPSKPPTVEGKFNFSSQLTGGGLNLVDLAQRAQGDMALTSKSGIFRGLASNGGTKTLSTASGIAGLLGKSKELVALGKLTTALQQFPYDQINVQLTRGQSLDVQLKDFSVISQQLRLTGTGGLTYEKGKSMLDQKLALQLQMGVLGDMETLMAALGKVSTDKDELGYTKVSRPIKIGGTPTNPDTSDLYAFLKEAGVSAATRAAERLLNLFGGKK